MKTYKFVVTMEVPDELAKYTSQVAEDLRFVLEKGFVQDVKIKIEGYRETHCSNLVREDCLLEGERRNPSTYEIEELLAINNGGQ